MGGIEDYRIELTIGEADVMRQSALLVKELMLRKQLHPNKIHFPLLLTAISTIENQFAELRERDLASVRG